MPGADWKRILCPVDFSDASRAAMEVAADLARRFGGDLVLLHAYPVPGYTFPDGSVVASPKMMQELADQAKRVTVETAIGEPAAEILEVAKARGADLVVMGTHGRTGLEHALMGSIAERVVRRALAPVLTVRPARR